jgi:hypothetical protein
MGDYKYRPSRNINWDGLLMQFIRLSCFLKYSSVKEYLYICVNEFEYGRKFHSLKEV